MMRDSKKCSQASMNVVIGEENDNSPIMEKSEIELNLRENMAVGAFLLKVSYMAEMLTQNLAFCHFHWITTEATFSESMKNLAKYSSIDKLTLRLEKFIR